MKVPLLTEALNDWMIWGDSLALATGQMSRLSTDRLNQIPDITGKREAATGNCYDCESTYFWQKDSEFMTGFIIDVCCHEFCKMYT